METQKSERTARLARLARLENAIRFAAANPGTDFSQEAEEEEVFDPFRNSEPDADEEMKGKRNLFEISW